MRMRGNISLFIAKPTKRHVSKYEQRTYNIRDLQKESWSLWSRVKGRQDCEKKIIRLALKKMSQKIAIKRYKTFPIKSSKHHSYYQSQIVLAIARLPVLITESTRSC